MNRRYIDFAPVRKRGEAPAAANAPVREEPLEKRGPVARPRHQVPQAQGPSRKMRTQHTDLGKHRVDAGMRPALKAPRRMVRPQVKPAPKRDTEFRFDAETLKRPVSDFTDLDQLAADIADVTGNRTTIETEVVEIDAHPSKGLSLSNQPQFGVVENFQPKFVKTQVEKRPLSPSFAVARAAVRVTQEAPAAPAPQVDKTKMRLPQARFINQNKVAKRPLSKNVYARPIEMATPESAAKMGLADTKATDAADKPLKIVSEPKKGRKMGALVAIIGTIVLGAVAGTVAFLLLPR